MSVLENGSHGKTSYLDYENGIWYRVGMINDVVNRTYDVYIDDVLMVSDVPMSPKGKPNKFEITAGNYGICIFESDNFST